MFSIGAACYPEGHVEMLQRKHADWDIAARKVEAGTDFLITQLFYDWSNFLDMWDYLRNKRNIKVPIVPGVLPFFEHRAGRTTHHAVRIEIAGSTCARSPLKRMPATTKPSPQNRRRSVHRYLPPPARRGRGRHSLLLPQPCALPGDHEESQGKTLTLAASL